MKEYRDISENFSLGYGEFPYIIIREWHGVYRQIPVNVGDLDEHQPKLKYSIRNTTAKTTQYKKLIKNELFIESIKKLALQAHMDYNKRSCLVLSPKRCIYFEDGRIENESKSIPAGGKLLDMKGETIGQGGIHYKIPVTYFIKTSY